MWRNLTIYGKEEEWGSQQGRQIEQDASSEEGTGIWPPRWVDEVAEAAGSGGAAIGSAGDRRGGGIHVAAVRAKDARHRRRPAP